MADGQVTTGEQEMPSVVGLKILETRADTLAACAREIRDADPSQAGEWMAEVDELRRLLGGDTVAGNVPAEWVAEILLAKASALQECADAVMIDWTPFYVKWTRQMQELRRTAGEPDDDPEE